VPATSAAGGGGSSAGTQGGGGGRGVRCGVDRPGGLLRGEVGVPPLVVACGARPERAEDPAGLLAFADRAPYAPQVPGDGQGRQGGGDGLLAVERELFGELLHTHSRAFGEVVDEPGDIPLARRQEREIMACTALLVRCGPFAVSGLGHRVRGGECGGAEGGARLQGSHGIDFLSIVR
jgi:hypothetical protein